MASGGPKENRPAWGTAKNAAEKALVTRLTEDIQGVKDVRNEMQVQVQG